MEFEWDEEKANINLTKHGISFETAAQCFVSQRITKVDDRKDYGEVRYQTLGMTTFGVVLHIVYTMRGETIRLISARKANKRERTFYGQSYP